MTDNSVQIGNGSMPLRIGNLINTRVFGGPYRECPAYMFGIKMAAEIDFPHDLSIPTRDFSVPKVSDLRTGIIRALSAMIAGQEVYAGCMGGWGRTGIFLAALAKVQTEYRKTKHRKGSGQDPVKYVRACYSESAVETQEQEQFIKDLDVSEIVAWFDHTQNVLGLGGVTPPIEETAMEQDWLDAPEPDSADIMVSKSDAEIALFMSLQLQIDELREDIDEQATISKGIIVATKAAFKAISHNFDLVDLTLGQRIANWFKKRSEFKGHR